VLSNITVYLIAWFFLGIRERPNGDELIGKDDALAFRNIVLVMIFVVLSIDSVNEILADHNLFIF